MREKIPNQMLRKRLKSGLWLLAKVAVSLTFLYLATRKINLSAIGEDVRHLNVFWFALAAVQLMLIPVLGGQRWRLVLRALGSTLGLWASTRMFWIGMLFSQVLPSSSGGDAVRIVLAWRGGVPFARAAHSVILERLAMVATLIVVVVILQVIGMKGTPFAGGTLLAPLLLCGLVVGTVLLLYADTLVGRLKSWRPFAALAELSADARRSLLSPSGAKLAGFSVLTHVNLAIGTFWLGRSLGLQLQLLDYLLFTSLVTLVTSLPLTIGGWGIREGTIVTLFGSVGIAAHSALAFSILYGVSVAVIGLCALPFTYITPANAAGDEQELVGVTTPQ
jgi:uncharacterized membrane protein YbhN (UPF0104 family)